MTPSILSPDGLVGIVFLVTIAITLTGGFITCVSESLIRALSGLALASVGVGGLYYFLNSPFISMMQILIYVGAVSVVISFGIMLASPEGASKRPSNAFTGPIGLTTAALLGGGLITMAVQTHWQAHPKTTDGGMYNIGIQLLTNYSMVFELISIVLLVAIIGALAIARGGRGE